MTIILKQQAAKYITTGGHFSMFELMYLTGILEKSLRNVTDDRRQQVLSDLETIAQKAEGSLIPLSSTPKTEKKFSSFFKKSTTNVGVDNRCSYLNLKAAILRSLNRRDECVACVTEILQNSHLLTDKMHLALATLMLGKVQLKENNKDDATKNFEAVMKMNDFMWENPIKSQARMILEQLGIEQKIIDTAGEDGNSEDISKLLEDEDLGALIKEEQDEQGGTA